MSSVPQARTPYDNAPCILGCSHPHESDPVGEGWFCCLRAGSVPVGTDIRGRIADVEVGADRFIPPPEYADLATPTRVTVYVPCSSLLTLNPAAARELARLLLAVADQVERTDRQVSR
jgi:hypothetical protein